MRREKSGLTPTEWKLMECLWEKPFQSGREATEYLEEKIGWSRSTTLTMLRRMTEKGLICCEEQDGIKMYSPVLLRKDAVLHETHEFIERVYKGSISLMMNAITEKQALSREEIDELYAILRKAEEAEEND